MTMMTVTIQETDRADGATLVLPREEATRLGLATGQTVTLEVKSAGPREQWEGIVVTPQDLVAMRREVLSLEGQGGDGGVSPTLERLTAEAEAEGHVARTRRV